MLGGKGAVRRGAAFLRAAPLSSVAFFFAQTVLSFFILKDGSRQSGRQPCGHSTAWFSAQHSPHTCADDSESHAHVKVRHSGLWSTFTLVCDCAWQWTMRGRYSRLLPDVTTTHIFPAMKKLGVKIGDGISTLILNVP